ncbi:MAG: FecR domain-containing protein [Thermodesulfobacteriota bacterium]
MIFLSAVFILPHFASALDKPAAVVKVFAGEVALKSRGAFKNLQIKKATPFPKGGSGGIKDYPVSAGDELRLARDAKAQVVFLDGSFVNITGEAVFSIGYYSNQGAPPASRAIILFSGNAARFVVSKATKSYLSVKTPTAVITGGNSDFVISSDEKRTVISVISESAVVRNSSPLIVNEAVVKPGRSAVIASDAPPSSPVMLSRKELSSLIRQNTFSETTR